MASRVEKDNVAAIRTRCFRALWSVRAPYTQPQTSGRLSHARAVDEPLAACDARCVPSCRNTTGFPCSTPSSRDRASALSFCVEGHAAIRVASTMVPSRSNSPFAARCSATAVKIAFVRFMTLKLMAEIEDRDLVEDRVAAVFEATNARMRLI